jgi:hypothetical protein
MKVHPAQQLAAKAGLISRYIAAAADRLTEGRAG